MDDNEPFGRGRAAWQASAKPTDADIAEDYLRRIEEHLRAIKYCLALLLFLAGLAGVAASFGVR